jgi:hypothetical protein
MARADGGRAGSSERRPWWRQGGATVIERRYVEAAAHMALMQDFEVQGVCTLTATAAMGSLV